MSPISMREAGEALAGSGALVPLSALLASYPQGHSRQNVLQFDLMFLPCGLASLARFFVLGQAVSLSEIRNEIGASTLDALAGCGVVSVSGESAQLTGLRLVEHYGCLLLCDMRSAAAQRYYGQDSWALGRYVLSARRGRVLDLCCGVGAQAILGARIAGGADGIDSNPRVADLFDFNAALNGMDACTSLYIGDIHLAADLNQRYTTVVCNPPLVPIPSDLPFPAVGDGGQDGLKVTARAMTMLPSLLVPDGVGLFVGMCLGDDTGPSLAEIGVIAQSAKLDMTIVVTGSMATNDHAFLRSITRTVAGATGSPDEQWFPVVRRAYSSLSQTRVFLCTFVIRPGAAAGVKVSANWRRGMQGWTL